MHIYVDSTMKINYLNELKSKSISQLIRDGYFESSIKYPKTIPRPRLPINHTSDRALEYAKELVKYEENLKWYNTQLKAYNGSKVLCNLLFKWACLHDIGAFDPKINPDAKTSKAFELAWNMAWERGHSSGIHEVYQELLELNEILICFVG